MTLGCLFECSEAPRHSRACFPPSYDHLSTPATRSELRETRKQVCHVRHEKLAKSWKPWKIMKVHFVRTENLENPCHWHQKLLGRYVNRKKILQIRRDLVESYSRHILKFSRSKSEIQKNIFKSATKVKNQPNPFKLTHFERFVNTRDLRL